MISAGGNKLKNYLGYIRCGVACVSLIWAMALQPDTAEAGVVTLTSLNDTTHITGEFIAYKDGNYIINTELGELKFSSKGVYCEGADCPPMEALKAKIFFTGSYALGQGLMPLLIEGYADQLGAELTVSDTQNPNEIQAGLVGDNGYGEEIGSYRVTSKTTKSGFAELLTRQDAINMASRRINTKEARALRRAGKGNMVNPDQEHVIAMDSLVVIVNPQNPVSSISVADLRAIYSGAIRNWSDLGGDDRPISVLAHPGDSEASSLFNSVIYENRRPRILKSAIIRPDNEAIATMVNDDLGAIGFVGYAFQRGAKPLNLISECGIINSPDPFSVKTEEYMLERRLYLYTANDASQDIREFISYATSPDADILIEKSGFIDFGITMRQQTMDDLRATTLRNTKADTFESSVIQDMLTQMINTSRLSTTFRFRAGSLDLDELGQLTLQRLVRYLETLPAGTSIKMVGFTDRIGAFEANRRISIGRAQQVINLLQDKAGDKLSHIEFTASGFGEIAPSGCNDSESGRRINRRVEVWVSE